MTERARILVVDDERSIRELLEIVLKKEGFAVTVAQNAIEGLDRTKTIEFDLVVSDINMPDMSGIDLLKALRASNFSGHFILLTAFATAETAIQALTMGACEYVRKSECLIELLTMLG